MTTMSSSRDYDGDIRQLADRGLGHEHPTILITNDLSPPPPSS